MPRSKYKGPPGRLEDSRASKTTTTHDPKNGNPVEFVRLDSKKRAVVSYIKNFAPTEEPLKGLSKEIDNETRTHEITSVSLFREMISTFKKEKVKELGILVKCAKEPGSNISLMLLNTTTANYIIDIFKLKDLSYFNEVLLDQNIVKVMYNTNYTLKLLEKYFGSYVVNTFDLEVAAEWLKKKPSLESIVKDLIKDLTVPARVEKDWDVRPLPQINKERAIFEIKYLLQLHHHLHDLLQTSGQLGRFLNECNQFAAKVYKILDYIKQESDPVKESKTNEERDIKIVSPKKRKDNESRVDVKRLKFSPPSDSVSESEPTLEFIPPGQSGEKKNSLVFEPPEKVEEKPVFFEPPDSKSDKFQIDYFEIDTAENLSRMLDGFKRGVTELSFNLKCSEDSKIVLLLFSSSGDNFIVDALKLGDSLAELKGILLDPGITKITYNADLVLKLLQNQFGLRIVGLFDIDLAARLLGYTNTSWCSLLLRSFPHLKLPRNVKYGWDRRPLDVDNKICASFEISYYPILYKLLNSELLENNKLFDLMQECYKKCEMSHSSEKDNRVNRQVKGHNQTSKYPENVERKSLKFEPNLEHNSKSVENTRDAKTCSEIFGKDPVVHQKPNTGSDISNPVDVIKLLKNATEFLNKKSTSSEFALPPGSLNVVDFVKTLQTAVSSIKNKTPSSFNIPKKSADSCRDPENISYNKNEQNIEPYSNRLETTASIIKSNFESNFYRSDVQSKISEPEPARLSESEPSRQFAHNYSFNKDIRNYKEPNNFGSYSKNQSDLNIKGKSVPFESNFNVCVSSSSNTDFENRGNFDSYKNVRNAPAPETVVSASNLLKTGQMTSHKDNKNYRHDTYGGSSDSYQDPNKFVPVSGRSERRDDNCDFHSYQNPNKFVPVSGRSERREDNYGGSNDFDSYQNPNKFVSSGRSERREDNYGGSSDFNSYQNPNKFVPSSGRAERREDNYGGSSDFDSHQNQNKFVPSSGRSERREDNYSSGYGKNMTPNKESNYNFDSYKNFKNEPITVPQKLATPSIFSDGRSGNYGNNMTYEKVSTNVDYHQNVKNSQPFNPSDVKEFNYSSNYGNKTTSYKEFGNLGSCQNVQNIPQKFVPLSDLPVVREESHSSGYRKNLTAYKESPDFDSYNSRNVQNTVPNFNPTVAPPGRFVKPANHGLSNYNMSPYKSSQPGRSADVDFKNVGRDYGNANFDYKNMAEKNSANFPHPNPGGFSRSFPNTTDVRSCNSNRQSQNLVSGQGFNSDNDYQNNQRSSQQDQDRFEMKRSSVRNFSSDFKQDERWYQGDTEQRNQTQGKRNCPFPYQVMKFKK